MSSRKISDLHPLFQQIVQQLLDLGNQVSSPYQFFITDGLRTMQEQTTLYAQGRTTPGKIVTMAKAGESAHNFGLAVDFAFQKDGVLSYDPSLYAKVYPIARKLGIVLGADWKDFPDKPHFEFPNWHSVAYPSTPPNTNNNENGGTMPSSVYYPSKENGYDLNNKESMKVCVDIKMAVDRGEFIRRTEIEKTIQENVDLQTRDIRIIADNNKKQFEDLWDAITAKTPQDMITRYDNGKLQVYFERYTDINDKLIDAQREREQAQADYNSKIGSYQTQIQQLSKDIELMKINHAKEIDDLTAKATALQDQLNLTSQEKERINRIAVFIDSLLRFFPRKQNETEAANITATKAEKKVYTKSKKS